MIGIGQDNRRPGVEIVPARAQVCGHSASIVNENVGITASYAARLAERSAISCLSFRKKMLCMHAYFLIGVKPDSLIGPDDLHWACFFIENRGRPAGIKISLKMRGRTKHYMKKS
jgi:hypothetical protein